MYGAVPMVDRENSQVVVWVLGNSRCEVDGTLEEVEPV